MNTAQLYHEGLDDRYIKIPDGVVAICQAG